MQKIYAGIILTLIIGLILPGHGYCGWPINKTLPIEGRVTDVSIGEPIENAIILCIWRKEYVIGGPGGPTREKIASDCAVTDKGGKYRIPGKTSFHILSTFDSVSMYIMHPLYEEITIWGFYIKPPGTKEWIYRNERGERLDLVCKDGIVYYDISLLSLEEKFGINPSTETAHEFDNYLRITYSKDENYFVLARKLNILNKELLNYIIARLLSITNKLPDCEYKFRAKKRIESIKEYIQ